MPLKLNTILQLTDELTNKTLTYNSTHDVI